LACPYFVPRRILNDGSWPHPARLPLGAGWAGNCCAAGAETEPQPEMLREFCNLGNATRCPHLPAARDWDAIRFSVSQAGAERIVLRYVCERSHAPVEHGMLEFDLRSQRWQAAHADARVQRLAECYRMAWQSRQPAAA